MLTFFNATIHQCDTFYTVGNPAIAVQIYEDKGFAFLEVNRKRFCKSPDSD